MSRRRRVRHDLLSHLVAAELVAHGQPTIRNRRRLHAARRLFALRTTGDRAAEAPRAYARQDRRRR